MYSVTRQSAPELFVSLVMSSTDISHRWWYQTIFGFNGSNHENFALFRRYFSGASEVLSADHLCPSERLTFCVASGQTGAQLPLVFGHRRGNSPSMVRRILDAMFGSDACCDVTRLRVR